jgi:hypothetical protein
VTLASAASIAWPQLSAGGLLLGVVWMIVGGWLVPRRVLRDAQEQRDKWEAAWRESSGAVRELSGQVAELTEIGHTTTALLQSITSERRGTG